jgi:glutamate-1-semialdehyde 2,1-aminomutase
VTGYGSVFVTYFMPGPQPRTYADLLANNTDLFIGYRHLLREEGVFELPLNLKRSHISYAHTESDIDRLVDGTRRALIRARSDRFRASTGAQTMGGVRN